MLVMHRSKVAIERLESQVFMVSASNGIDARVSKHPNSSNSPACSVTTFHHPIFPFTPHSSSSHDFPGGSLGPII